MSDPGTNGRRSESPSKLDEAAAPSSAAKTSTGPEIAGPSGSPASETSQTTERTEPRTLELLVCPLTKSVLEYDAVRHELISRRANLAYPVRSGVPLLTREAARTLD